MSPKGRSSGHPWLYACAGLAESGMASRAGRHVGFERRPARATRPSAENQLANPRDREGSSSTAPPASKQHVSAAIAPPRQRPGTPSAIGLLHEKQGPREGPHPVGVRGERRAGRAASGCASAHRGGSALLAPREVGPLQPGVSTTDNASSAARSSRRSPSIAASATNAAKGANPSGAECWLSTSTASPKCQ